MKPISLLLFLIIALIGCDGHEEEQPIPTFEVFEGDLVFLSQQEINDFVSKGFTEVTGNVTIGTLNSPSLLISNLQGLQYLKTVGGHLTIQYNGAITN